MCGDYNSIPDKNMDLSSSTRNQQNRTTLAQFISSSGLYDVWRCQHSTERDFTFFSNVHHTYSRIDLFLVDKFLLQQIVTSDIYVITWFNHAPISIEVGDRRSKTRVNRWRNYIYALSQPENTKQISKDLKKFFEINAPLVDDPFTLWNAHKVYIRGLLIQMTTKLRRQRTKRFNDLTKIQNLENLNKLPHKKPETYYSILDRNFVLF